MKNLVYLYATTCYKVERIFFVLNKLRNRIGIFFCGFFGMKSQPSFQYNMTALNMEEELIMIRTLLRGHIVNRDFALDKVEFHNNPAHK